jgi:hypothetical protein
MILGAEDDGFRDLVDLAAHRRRRLRRRAGAVGHLDDFADTPASDRARATRLRLFDMLTVPISPLFPGRQVCKDRGARQGREGSG